MINIVIPMAGEGSRFKEQGYTFPKPLVEINGKPMIQMVVENITPKMEHRFTFVCNAGHLEKYSLAYMLNRISPQCNIVSVEKLTQGAACTVLLAADHFNNDNELLIANSDQFIDMDINIFLEDSKRQKLDGNIVTFHSSHPKWSYAKVGKNGFVEQVAEKKPISDDATAGVYYYREGKAFIDAAFSMIEKDIRVNNEFYVCPVFNEMILNGKKIGIMPIESSNMHGLGTPEDLAEFLKNKVSSKYESR